MSAVLITVLIIIAAVAAFFLGRWHGLSTGTKELTEELETKDKELNELKSGINEHFDETARLFSNLTEEYKTLYQHLSTGANKLSDRDFKLKLSAPVGADALPTDSSVTEASAAEVIDAEEHLSKEEVKEDMASPNHTDSDSKHEEESFIRNSADTAASDNAEQSADSANNDTTEPSQQPGDEEKPDLDIEVSPPKDWADDDMDDDYHPNDSRSTESEFTDLAKEETKKPMAPGYERNSYERNENDKKTDDKKPDEKNSSSEQSDSQEKDKAKH